MSEPQIAATAAQGGASALWQPKQVFVIAAVISLALVSFISFLWLGSSSLYYLAAWLGIHAYFFGVLEIKLKAQQDAPLLNLYQQAKALLTGQPAAAQPSNTEADKEEALRLSRSLETALLQREDAEQRDTAPASADRDPPLAGLDTAENHADDWDVGIADESDDGADSDDAAAEIDAQLAAADSSEAQLPRQRRVSVPPDSSPARRGLTAEQQAAALLQTPAVSAEAQQQQQVFQWEMGGRSQLLRRNTSQFITEEAEMVQELLESVSDAPTEASSEWRLVRDRRGARVWTSAVGDSPWYRIRGRVRCVGATPAQLLSLLIDDHRVSEYDRMFEQLREVQRLDDHTTVRWSAYKAVWPTRPRDFVIKSTWEEFADGTVVIATRSVEHPDCPETPTYVRGRMIMCGYVITPRDGGSSGSGVGGGTHSSSSSSVALRPSPRQRLPSNGGLGAGRRGSGMSFGDGSDSDDDSCDESEDAEGCDLILYTHTDLGGALPASIINRLCKKPAYRVLRQVQKMAAAGTLVSSSHSSSVKSGSGGLFVPAGLCMDRTNSEDVLQSLIDDGELENSDGQLLGEALDHIGEESDSGTDPAHRRRSYVNGTNSSSAVRSSRRHSSPTGPRAAAAAAAAVPVAQRKIISLAYAAAEARRIMALLERMASQRSGWVQLGPARVAGASSDTADMGLYKWPLPGTRRVRLGASATVRAAPEELLGLLLDSAAMLGPDYVVDGQQSIQTLSSSTGEGGSSSASTSSASSSGAQQDDTAIYWFSCTHRRQRIRRDFVILRCFHRLEGGGGLIAYATVDHPAYPPTAAFVRGKIDMCGFVVLPQKADEESEQQQQEEAAVDSSDSSDVPTPAAAAATGSSSTSTAATAAAAAAAPPSVATSDTALQQLAASEVYFYTHLSFSEHLPALEDNARASRHLVGPLHILQELRRVVDRTLEYGASARGGAGGSGGCSRDRSRGGSSSTGRRDSMREPAVSSEGCADGQLLSTEESSSGEHDCPASSREHENSSASVSTAQQQQQQQQQQQSSERSGSSSSAALVPTSGVNSTAASRITAQREAALRDLLTLASDGESMDGPRVAWQLVRDGGESGVKLWKCALPGSAWSMIRTRTRLAASPSTVLDLLLDDSRIGEYDDLFDKIRVVEVVDEQAAFKRTVYKPVWPTAPRDFSLLCSWGRLEDGSAYLVNRSVAHPDCPEVRGFVRGIVMMCGFLLVPTAPASSSTTVKSGAAANSGDSSSSGSGGTTVTEPQSCTLTMVVHSELGGNLPVGIVNKISTGAPAMVSNKLQKLFAGSKGRANKQ